MESQQISYAVDYLVRTAARPKEAIILKSGREVAALSEKDRSTHLLRAGERQEWIISRKVHDRLVPFSVEIIDAKSGEMILVILHHLFSHRGCTYMITNSPQGRPLREFILGSRYICRLDAFPYRDISEIDKETWSRVRSYRGVQVGEMSGLGKEGHHVQLTDELDDIGLQLSAACYLLYSTG